MKSLSVTSTHLVRALAAALLALPLLVGCASHQPSHYTVAQALAAPDDSKVVITGDVVQQSDDRHLLVRDTTGQISVRVEEGALGKVTFAPDATVRVSGTIDRNSERSLLIAKQVQVLD